MEFKDRAKELKEIKEVLDSRKFEFLVLYGRRRVGKTELVLNATKDRKRIYFLATGERSLEHFYKVCSEFDEKVLPLKMDFEVLFDYLKDKAEVVIIDEFQEMIKEDKTILNIFQKIIDTKLANSNLKLILLGSSVSIIGSKVLSYQSPLYGRRTGSIKLKPVSFFDLKEFFPHSINELMEIYAFADGIPFYLIKITPPFWEWFQNEIKTDRSFLRDEIDFIMKYEFDNASTYKLILEALAHGKTKLNEIKDHVKLPRTDLSPYIKNLLEVDLIKREVPITENIKSRYGRYYLKDNFLKFWFRFIYPNLSSIEAGIFDINSIKSDYNAYLGFIFEDISKQFLIKEAPFQFNKIGKWWHKDKEIDIVCLDEQKKEALFIECKWSDLTEKEALKILEEVKEKLKFVEQERNKEYFGLIGKKILGKERLREEGWLVWDLEDIEKAYARTR